MLTAIACLVAGMNKRKLATGIRKKLRDPIWQAVGAFIGFVAILASFVIAYITAPPQRFGLNRLMISNQTSKELTDFAEPVSKRMRFLIDDKEERELRLFIFMIEYKGDQPVRSSDFAIPIRGTIPSARKLIAVQKSTNLEGPLRLDKETGRIHHDEKPAINFEVNLLDQQTFEIKPLLMNPGEWFGLEIYTAAQAPDEPTVGRAPQQDATEKYKTLYSELSWSCHVAGVECPGSVDLNRDLDFIGGDAPWFLQVNISHEGWSVYFILLFTILNLITMVLLGKAAGLGAASPVIQLLLFSLAIASSVSSGEVAADWLFPGTFEAILDLGQPLYAYIIFWLNVVIIFGLAAVSFWKRIKRSLVQSSRSRN